ncbi:MAG: M23 family metallopeptidase [Myxococcota bacterium]
MPIDIPLGARPKPNRTPLLLGGVILVAAVGLLYIGYRAGGQPTIEITAAKEAVSQETTIDVVVREPVRGLAAVSVVMKQNDKTFELVEESFTPQPAWASWQPKTDEKSVTVKVGKAHQTTLEEGPATVEVRVSGAGTWLYDAPEATASKTLQVRLKPPPLAVTASEVYVMQGGAEVVTYSVGPTSVKDGVVAGEWFFKGYPHPNGDKSERIALFAVPYDMSNVDDVRVIAEDDVGNRAEAEFINNFRPKPYNTDTINVSTAVMKALVPKIRARTPDLPDKGSLLANYVAINRDLRKANNQRLRVLAQKTQPKFLWRKSFVQMSAKVVSSFADRRTYLFEGRKIDQQDHLGFDLASVRRAEVPAANDGIVVMAEYLGIYGRALVIDHGMGLMSLYAHCSSISVEVGDRVKRGQTVARTGVSGLALGDHLHFTMLLSGLPVTPLEWWDGHWIQDRIVRKLPDIFKSVKE